MAEVVANPLDMPAATLAELGEFYRTTLPALGHYCLMHMPTKRHFWHDDREKFIAAAGRAARQAGVYAAPASFDDQGQRRQTNVELLQCFWIDADAGAEKLAKHGPGAVYADDREAQRGLIRFCKEAGLPPSYVIHSGAGLHVYWALAEPITREVWQPLAQALGALAKAHGFKADPACTTDAVRVLRVPGTIHGNGNTVRIVHKTGKRYDLAEFRQRVGAADGEGVPALAAPARPARIDVNSTLPADDFPPYSAVQVAKHCVALGNIAAVRGEVSEPQWRAMLGLLKLSTEGLALAHEWSRGHADYDPDDTERKFSGWHGTGPTTCVEFEKHDPAACAGCPHRGKITSPAMLGRDAPTPTLSRLPMSDQEAGAPTADAGCDQDDEEAHATDLGLSKVFVKWNARGFKHDHGHKVWRRYDRGSWKPCRKGEQQEAFKKISGALLKEAGKASEAKNSDRAKRFVACAMRAQSANGIDAALKLAASDPSIAVSADEFDRDPALINVANGVVHLPTGELRPHDPALMLSRQCPVDYIPDATSPTWDRFLHDVTTEDPDLIDYMQRVCGYTLSGHVGAEKLFFMLGQGANGKSVFANVMRHILGTYAVVVPSAFLMLSSRDGGSATPELAMIAGARLVLANEVEAGATMSAQTVKTAASTEAITARPLYGHPFTFIPTHKVWVRGNHKPIIRDNDEGIWRRLDLIPFERNFAPEERDPGLEATLLTEAPGILAWMVKGFSKWQRDGLRPAARVAAASRAYRAESDLLMQWVTDQCTTGAGLTMPQRMAYANYRGWCDDQGLRSISKRSFTRGLAERGIGEKRDGGGTRQELYTGLELRSVVHR